MDCEAVILRLQDYRESDRLVWLLTTEHGRLSAVARGARKSARRFGGHLDLFHRVEATVSDRARGPLRSLTQVRSVESFPSLRADITRFAAANVIAELAAAVAPEGAPDLDQYRAVVDGYRLLEAGVGHALSITATTILELLTAAGFVMDLSECTSCGAPLSEDTRGVRLLPGRGLTCDRCPTGGGLPIRLANGDLQTLVAWQAGHAGPGPSTTPSRGAQRATFAIVREVLGRALKSEKFLMDVLPP